MRFEWDEEKNQANHRKHGLSFADAPEIFDAPMLVDLDDRFDYGIISLRKALSHERRAYEEELAD